jgi:hypothetical protein
MIDILLLHPGADVGYLPDFLDEEDPRPAKEQFNQHYGWRPLPGCELHGIEMHYPGDPPYVPIAMIKFRDEIILLYQADFVGIVEKGGAFECARMD